MTQSAVQADSHSADFRPCLIVPVFNHAQALEKTMAALEPYDLPCLVVDDGSDAPCAARIRALAQSRARTTAMRLDENGGKGAAMKVGLRWAHDAGFTHALQIDADNQHDANAVAEFLILSSRHPAHFIIGQAQFDSSIPRVRRLARHLTHFWVMINTLSRTIKDSMCGFRVYPLTETVRILDGEQIGNRMEFDVEILVKAHWRGGKFVNVPTQVSYPMDGVSHFRMVRDNALISRMHARCFFGMLRRAPQLMRRSA